MFLDITIGLLDTSNSCLSNRICWLDNKICCLDTTISCLDTRIRCLGITIGDLRAGIGCLGRFPMAPDIIWRLLGISWRLWGWLWRGFHGIPGICVVSLGRSPESRDQGPGVGKCLFPGAGSNQSRLLQASKLQDYRTTS